ncbi:MAG: hypothetical protein P4L92_12660 [Rudaea sp.]|nr:hypothetical protein [Rudaea sp.]
MASVNRAARDAGEGFGHPVRVRAELPCRGIAADAGENKESSMSHDAVKQRTYLDIIS